jgi:hypothetical protein
MSVVFDWNGEDVPEELKELPAGRYVLESIDEAPPLTAAEEQGLFEAMRSIDEGRGVDADTARGKLEALARK